MNIDTLKSVESFKIKEKKLKMIIYKDWL